MRILVWFVIEQGRQGQKEAILPRNKASNFTINSVLQLLTNPGVNIQQLLGTNSIARTSLLKERALFLDAKGIPEIGLWETMPNYVQL